MNNIEAIEQLKWLRNKSQLRIDKDFTEPLDMAISVLEKQIAKPCTYCQKKDITIFYNDLLTVKIDCDNELEIEFQDGRETKIEWIKIECCPKCGRSLDWSVEE